MNLVPKCHHVKAEEKIVKENVLYNNHGVTLIICYFEESWSWIGRSQVASRRKYHVIWSGLYLGSFLKRCVVVVSADKHDI